MKKYIYILLLIPTLFLTCRSVDKNTFSNFTEAPLFGMIYDTESLPVVGAELVLDDKDTALTDINGRVLFGAVSRGEHLIVINKEGFEEARMVLNFSNRDQVLYSTLISLRNIIANLESSLKVGDILEARSLLDRASIINPDDIRLRYLKVVYLSDNMKYKEAFEEIVLLRKLFQDDPSLIMTQAKILFYGFNKKSDAVELLMSFPLVNSTEEIGKLVGKMTSEINYEERIKETEGENNE